MPIRIALVNDDEVVGHGLGAMLRPYEDRVQVATLAGNGPSRPVDVALCDTVGRTRATAEIAELTRNPAVLRTVVYTWNFQPWFARQCLDAGASGYLSKSLPAADLVNALLAVHDGKQVIAPAPGARGEGDWPGREEGLTAREAEVLTLIAQGCSNVEIAELTCLSINSIKSYIRSCYRKIDVTSRSRAVLWGIEHGLGPDSLRTSAEPA